MEKESFLEERRWCSNERALVCLAWLLFLIQGLFYTSLFPAWEGFDEPAHLAYIAFLHDRHSLPIYGRTQVSNEIQSSIETMPVPESLRSEWELRYSDPRNATPSEGTSKTFLKIPLYEAQHPPLYYLLMLPVYEIASSWNILDRLFAVRFGSVLLVSLFVFAAFGFVRRLVASHKLRVLILFSIIAFPGLYIDIARVGNDSLGLLLYTVLCCQTVLLQESLTWKNCILTGCVLGLGLLTKLYFLPAIIPLTIIAAAQIWRSPEQRMRLLLRFSFIPAVSLILASPWFIWCYHTYGVVFVTHETIALTYVSLGAKLHQAIHMPWAHELDVLFKSFVWVGGWSILDLPKEVYDFFKLLFLVAVLGGVIHTTRNAKSTFHSTGIPLLFVAGFLAATLQFSVLSFMTRHVFGGAGGWYLYCLIVPITVLVVYGLSGVTKKPVPSYGWPFALILGLGLINLYGVFFRLIPVYCGFPASSLSRTQQFNLLISHPSQSFVTLCSRLALNKPPILSATFFRIASLFFLIAVIVVIVVPLSQNFLGKTEVRERT
jgi:4-amino-4-deoxy-L-arabinose transferase-like glycosyltransferase